MRLLLLSYCFPPASMAEGFVTAKAMGALGYETDVYCADASNWSMQEDRSLDGYVGERFRSVHSVELPGRSISLRIASRLPIVREVPDQLRLANAALRRSLSHVRLEQYDVVVSRSEFHSVHLVALWIKRRHPQLPWIASFSDPWVCEPIDPRPKVIERANLRLERQVFRAADRLVFTSDAAMDYAMRRHPSELRRKALAIPHCYDPVLYPRDAAPLRRSVPTAKQLVVRSVGSFYKARPVTPLIDALDRLATSAPHVLHDVSVEFIGPVDGRSLQTGMGLFDRGRFRISPPVNYVASLGLMRTADVLVVVDANDASSIYLPSKLIDYVGAARPIAALTPPGPAARVVEGLGGWVGHPQSPEEGAAALAGALQAARDAGSNEWGTALRHEYTVGSIAERWHSLIGQLARQEAPVKGRPMRAHGAFGEI